VCYHQNNHDVELGSCKISTETLVTSIARANVEQVMTLQGIVQGYHGLIATRVMLGVGYSIQFARSLAVFLIANQM
jgi:hypothetical protein